MNLKNVTIFLVKVKLEEWRVCWNLWNCYFDYVQHMNFQFYVGDLLINENIYKEIQLNVPNYWNSLVIKQLKKHSSFTKLLKTRYRQCPLWALRLAFICYKHHNQITNVNSKSFVEQVELLYFRVWS